MTVCVAKYSSAKLLKMIPIAKPIIGEDEISAVTAVLRSGIIAQGRKVEEFEVSIPELWDGKAAERIVDILYRK
jgi:dTDP-4-amino-4,6-dideoxygalactose transaminase